MNAAVVRRPQEALGKVIRRRPLTEKLLSKPPSRYLHDIITEKAIDVVIMVSGEPLSAKPTRIVAGHEPERTNELLQLIGKCCVNKLSSEDAVKRVLSGEKGDAKGKSSLMPKSQELDNKNAKEEESRIHRDKEDRRNSEIKEKYKQRSKTERRFERRKQTKRKRKRQRKGK
ncbi:TRAF3-interacting protein 1-like isoform X2 [Tamandua tetradactyla]|uniref:TRAF3-interacting protein 1-like isoform X2 n=1 Tax=Tamandua tetradactyla TaxID=48850 RepID=UPI004054385A